MSIKQDTPPATKPDSNRPLPRVVEGSQGLVVTRDFAGSPSGTDTAYFTAALPDLETMREKLAAFGFDAISLS